MTRVAHPDVKLRESGSTQHPHGPSRAMARVAVEFGLPVAAYYGLRAGNVDIFSALLTRTLPPDLVPALPSTPEPPSC